jgi:hypothetical protein
VRALVAQSFTRAQRLIAIDNDEEENERRECVASNAALMLWCRDNELLCAELTNRSVCVLECKDRSPWEERE